MTDPQDLRNLASEVSGVIHAEDVALILAAAAELVGSRAEAAALKAKLGRVQDTINAEKWSAAEYYYDVPSWVVNLEMDIGPEQTGKDKPK